MTTRDEAIEAICAAEPQPDDVLKHMPDGSSFVEEREQPGRKDFVARVYQLPNGEKINVGYFVERDSQGKITKYGYMTAGTPT